MLSLKRGVDQRIRLRVKDKSADGVDTKPAVEIWLVISEVRGKQVSLGITAPPNVEIKREEVINDHPQRGTVTDERRSHVN